MVGVTEQTSRQVSAENLPTSWNPADVEQSLYEQWVDRGYFTADPNSDKPPFSIVLPPPNVTGQLHMGHALDHTLMDALARRKRMQGYEVLWLPGMDHAGIATQSKVEGKLLSDEGKSRLDYGREAFIERVWEWKQEYGGKIGSQMRAIGDSVDWSKERFTLDEGLNRAVTTIFKNLYDQGMIYRAHRLVNWSPVLETAVSDIEVIYKEVEGELVSIRYGSLNDDEPHVVVATTRVETMLGDVAVAVHPDDERYQDLVGTRFAHPFVADREIVVIADDYVDPEFGTGAVKITPAHDPNDYAMGLRHNLAMIDVMDDTAHIAGTGTEFDGMDRYEARVKIREALAEQGRIEKEVRPYVHSVGHSERSGEPVEPRLSDQWYVKVEQLAAMAGDAIRQGDTQVHPVSMEPRYFDWVDDMHDWCISRQLWWGHRIPIWYGPDGEVVCCGPDDTPPAGYTQDPDVLDTWFSSALWPFSTLGWPENTALLEKFYPTSVLVTAYDILFFWVARMMMFGTFAATLPDSNLGATATGRPQVPFTDLFIHGLVRDEHGRKMSKSLGNGIDPMDWVADYGADALRFTLARGANPGTDLPLGVDAAQSSRNFCTKLFNATRFALMNGAYVGDLPQVSELTSADRWILDRLEQVRAQVDDLLDRYQFAKATELLYQFAWGELCDWYLEIAKVQIPRDEATASEAALARGDVTRRVLGHSLDVVLRLLHPFIPFVTETLWRQLTGGESVVIADWPTHESTAVAPEACAVSARRIDDVVKLVTEIRRFRSDQGIKPSAPLAARFDAGACDLADEQETVFALTRITPAGDGFRKTGEIEMRLTNTTTVVEFDTSDSIDVEAETKRLTKDRAAAEKELATTAAKLGNEQFLAKAPDHVVEKIKQRQAVAQAEYDRISARLEELAQR
nr:valine--tRNA ligase [Corynebacterium choanae]